MKQTVRLLVPLSFILALLIPGCYTVFLHPDDELGYSTSYLSDCTSCHAEYEEFPYGYYYPPYPDFWWDHPAYASYFAHPWWWSKFDNYNDNRRPEYGDSDRIDKFDEYETDGYPPPPPYVHPIPPPGNWGPIINFPQQPAGSGGGDAGQGTSTGGDSQVKETPSSTDDKPTRDGNVKSGSRPTGSDSKGSSSRGSRLRPTKESDGKKKEEPKKDTPEEGHNRGGG